MTHGNKKCGTCEIPYFERNNYYYGKLMTARDFRQEQYYFNEKRWLINRMVHGWGIVCGLDVRLKPVDPKDPRKGFDDKKVLVTPGFAIDSCGREILVCEEQEVELIPEGSDCRAVQTVDKKTYDICLQFYECRTEQISIPGISCESKEKYGFNYIRDSFRLYAREAVDNNSECTCRICPLENKSEYLFNWDKIPEEDSNRFIEFLIRNYNINWVKKDDITKSESTITVSEGKNSLSLRLDDEKARVYLTISDGRTDELVVRVENDVPNIYRIETVNKYLCKRLKEGCHKCTEPPCLVLGEVTIAPSSDPPIKINNCSKREFVYSNPLLYNLIDCYHGDLPHVVKINWKENGAAIPWEEFYPSIYDGGVKVEFDCKMDKDTINTNTFLFLVKMEDADTGNYRYEQVPGDVSYDENASTATFKFTSKWLADVYFGYSRIREKGGEFMVVLKSDFIMSAGENGKPTKALDGNFIGGRLPSGNGTQGGDFISWFSVAPKEETAQKKFK